MTEYNIANVDNWVKKHDRVMDAVARQALNDMMKDIRIVPGRMRGGSPRPGQIPRDTGLLAASLQSSITGANIASATGNDSYTVLANMVASDTALFTWGSSKAHYAKHVHYGTSRFRGTFWVTEAVKKWQSYVTNAARRAREKFRGIG